MLSGSFTHRPAGAIRLPIERTLEPTPARRRHCICGHTGQT